MRYFIEVAYKGTNYSGFQLQANANTIQAEVEKAIQICCRQHYKLTGSSRTDAGVHAYQNYFHFDSETELANSLIYNLNSLLPIDIVVKKIIHVADNAHSRFDATTRQYTYHLCKFKNPFSNEIAWYYPYKVDPDVLLETAILIHSYTDFTSFSKLHTNTTTNDCSIVESTWLIEGEIMIYTVKANRFLRGMVRALVGTMLQAARGLINVEDFKKIIEARDCTKANFATPAKGLFLEKVGYAADILSIQPS